MATLTSSRVAEGISPRGLRVGMVTDVATYTVGSSLSTGDVIQMLKVPRGATPVYVAAKSTGGGSTGAGSVNVGDGVATGRYITGYVVSASAVLQPINSQTFAPYTYSVDDTIDLLVSVSSQSAPNSGTLMLMAVFSMDASVAM